MNRISLSAQGRLQLKMILRSEICLLISKTTDPRSEHNLQISSYEGSYNIQQLSIRRQEALLLIDHDMNSQLVFVEY